MSTSFTIRNLDESVKQKLRLRAASHQRSMDAEAREIPATSLAGPDPDSDREAAKIERCKRIESVIEIWKDRMGGKTTEEIMQELRGDE